MDVESEIRDLKRRVGELEGGSQFHTNQLRDVHRDLLGFQAETDARFDKVDGRLDRIDGRMDRVDDRLDKVDGRLDKVELRLGRVESEVRQLREDMPGIVGDAVREAFRESRS